MKTKKTLLAVIGLLGVLTSYSVVATNRPGATTLTLGEGAYLFAQKRHLDNTSIPNLALAYNFNSNWAVEGAVGVINTNQKPRIGNQGVHGFLYLVDGLYRFNSDRMFEPYVSLGVGVLGLTPNYNTSIEQGNVNAGIGAQLFVDNSIALRAEVKDIYTMSGGKNDVMLNFGVSFVMGGDSPVASVAVFK